MPPRVLRAGRRPRHTSQAPTDDLDIDSYALPRHNAGVVFEFLERNRQERLLKAMGQEDVANVLNSMITARKPLPSPFTLCLPLAWPHLV